ncbi:MAG TPA: peptidylprolyl isomerase [Anaerolineales bacterium]|nr:peptidylprolyl isomerase [Anaerolineales bacterium]
MLKKRPLPTILFSLFPVLLLTSCAAARPVVTPTAFDTPTPRPSPDTPAAYAGCSTIEAGPTPDVSSGLPPIDAADYVRGPADAAVTMITYCDFQSTGCQGFASIVDQLQAGHPRDLRVVFRPVFIAENGSRDPVLGQLDKSQLATEAALAAGDQGQFWQMRDLLHSQYADWTKMTIAEFNSWIQTSAIGLGLDGTQFAADYQSPETAARTKSMETAAIQLGIQIPIAFINGSLQPTAILDYNSLNDVVSMTALGARQFKSCPSFAIDVSRQYIATLHTEKGDIVIQLYADKAPLAANSFVFLARQGWYDGVTFQRVIPGFLAQTGDPSGTGKGGPGYFFKNEVSDLRYDKPGVVGMANSGPDTNGSQFFITYAPQPSLDGIYTVFGQVIGGMDVVESLTPRDPSQAGDLPPGDKILSVTIEEQ